MASIMIVDDAAFMRTTISAILEEAGHKIAAAATSGREAISLYRQLRPDLVTMDITMPDMNGIECVRELRAWDPNARIIMCSAVGQHELVLQAIEAGAKDFIVKPFFKDRLLSAVNQQLRTN